MPEAEATYKINNCPLPPSTKCVCGHTVAAHGSNGMICVVCKCKMFKEEFDPKHPVASKIG